MSGINRGTTDEESRLNFLNEEVGKVKKQLIELQAEKETVVSEFALKTAEFNTALVAKNVELSELTKELENLETSKSFLLGEIDELKKIAADLKLEVSEAKGELEEQHQLKKQAERTTEAVNQQIEVVRKQALELLADAQNREKKSLAEANVNQIEKERLKQYDASIQDREGNLASRERAVTVGLLSNEAKEEELDSKLAEVVKKEQFLVTRIGEAQTLKAELSEREAKVKAGERSLINRSESLISEEMKFAKRDVELKKREDDFSLRLAELNYKERSLKVREKVAMLTE